MSFAKCSTRSNGVFGFIACRASSRIAISRFSKSSSSFVVDVVVVVVVVLVVSAVVVVVTEAQSIESSKIFEFKILKPLADQNL